jgi:long-chain fatty acid transport protein
MIKQAVAVSILVSGPVFATNGYFASGYGIKSDGVAGAGIAFAQDSLTIATNPAGLSDIRDAFDVGVDVFLPQRSATLEQGGTATTFDGDGVSTFYIPSIGYARHLTSDLRWVLHCSETVDSIPTTA